MNSWFKVVAWRRAAILRFKWHSPRDSIWRHGTAHMWTSTNSRRETLASTSPRTEKLRLTEFRIPIAKLKDTTSQMAS